MTGIRCRIAAEKGPACNDVEQYLQKKYGLSLAKVWLSNGKVPERKSTRTRLTFTYTYSGKGKVPAWLKGHDRSLTNPAYEVKTN